MVLVTNDGAAGTSNKLMTTTMKATYAYGPLTVGYQEMSLMMQLQQHNDEDEESYSIAYTVSDEDICFLRY